jgi:SAM-dependent methyltransferase
MRSRDSQEEPVPYPSTDERRMHWDARSTLYGDDVRQAPIRAEALQLLLSLLPTGPQLVLDAGTGTGTTALAIKRIMPGSQIVASDFSPGMLAQARRQSGAQRVNWITAHTAHLPFKNESFDLVTSTFTLHHFPPPEQLAVLRELRRVVALHGRLLLIDQVAPTHDLEQEVMTEEVVKLFYSHLPRSSAEARLARFGEWPLTIKGFVSTATQAGLSAQTHVLHPLVSVFDLRVAYQHHG